MPHDDELDQEIPFEEAVPEEEPETLKKYWAALEPYSEEFASAVMEQVEEYYDIISRSGLHSIWEASYRAYFGIASDGWGSSHSGSSVRYGGEQGELSLVASNQYRSIMTQILAIVTQNRPAFRALARNSDYESQGDTLIAQDILEYYARQRGFEDEAEAAAELAVTFGEGFLHSYWDATAGDMVQDPETGGQRRSGDPVFIAKAPVDVIRKWTRSATQQKWTIVREFENRFDLAAQYPELEDKILELDTMEDQIMVGESALRRGRWSDETTDIPVYYVYVDRSPALPQGRHAIVLSDEVVLFDDELPYDRIPVFRVSPSNFISSCFGYSPMWDQIGLQDALNATLSSMLTNYDAHGVQNIWMEEGTQLQPAELAGGMRVWTIRAGQQPPQGVNLTKMPEGVEKFVQMVLSLMETGSGVNAVMRGNPQNSLGAGAPASAMALMHNVATQHNSQFVKDYAQMLPEVGTHIVKMLQVFAEEPRLAVMSGKHKKTYIKEFTRDDLAGVDRVIIDEDNPMGRSMAGRLQMAELLIQLNASLPEPFLKSPEQLVELISTGTSEPLYEGERSQLMLVRQENEALSNGEDVPFLIIDPHELHIKEHSVVLASPEARRDPAVVEVTLKHLQMHMDAMGPPPGMAPEGAPGQDPNQPGPREEGLENLNKDSPGSPPGEGNPPLPADPTTGEIPEGVV